MEKQVITGNPFVDRAAEYDQWFDSKWGAECFELELACLRRAIDTRDERWLEVGVGPGRFAQALGIQTGLDPSLSMVKLATARGIATSQGSGESLPYATASFDGVALICTFCFIDDPPRVLQECRRVLRAGGHLAIAIIPADSPWGVYHAWRGKQGHAFYASAHFYKSEELQQMAIAAGFTIGSEYGCVLPAPEVSEADADIMKAVKRQESFVVQSLSL